MLSCSLLFPILPTERQRRRDFITGLPGFDAP
jgi:hypothetical protein